MLWRACNDTTKTGLGRSTLIPLGCFFPDLGIIPDHGGETESGQLRRTLSTLWVLLSIGPVWRGPLTLGLYHHVRRRI